MDEKLIEYRLWEYYICNTDLIVEEFSRKLTLLNDCPDKSSYDNDNLIEINHGQYQRMKSFIDLDLAEKIYFYKREYLSTKQ
ncbi:unnamed protein product, partial [Rotaria magnacalcarata]